MGELKERFRATLERLLEAERIPVKSVFVGAHTLNVTFYGEESARKAASLFARFAHGLRVADGYDPGKATEIRQGRHADVHVWRVFGFIGGAPAR
jgi:hypothetical protein